MQIVSSFGEAGKWWQFMTPAGVLFFIFKTGQVKVESLQKIKGYFYITLQNDNDRRYSTLNACSFCYGLPSQ